MESAKIDANRFVAESPDHAEKSAADDGVPAVDAEPLLHRRGNAPRPGPGAWLARMGNRLARLLQSVVMIGAFVAGTICATTAIGESEAAVFAPTLWILLYYPAAAIHELGHYAAARLRGMRVVRMRISAIDFLPRRRGFRLRWRRLPRKLGIGGYVIAFADPAKPMKGPRIAMLLGGPLANLVLAGALLVAWAALQSSRAGWFALTFASMNAGLGIANLVPHKGKVISDGYQLMTLLTRRTCGYETPHARLMALSLFGRSADRLPEDDLSALESAAFPAPLAACWYRLKARQNRAEWEQAAACAAQLDVMAQAKNEAQLAPFKELISLLRTEIAFSQSMQSRDASTLLDGLLSTEANWYAPHLWPRCLALRAALAGDGTACARWLEASRKYADDTADDALPLSERMIRASMAGAFPGMWRDADIRRRACVARQDAAGVDVLQGYGKHAASSSFIGANAFRQRQRCGTKPRWPLKLWWIASGLSGKVPSPQRAGRSGFCLATLARDGRMGMASPGVSISSSHPYRACDGDSGSFRKIFIL